MSNRFNSNLEDSQDILNTPVEFSHPQLQLLEALRTEAVANIINSEFDDQNPTEFIKLQHHHRGIIAAVNQLIELHQLATTYSNSSGDN